MKSFQVDSYLTDIRLLESLLTKGSIASQEQVTDERKAIAKEHFSKSEHFYNSLGLTSSAITARKIIDLLSKNDCSHGKLGELVKELQERVIDEFSARRFFSMSDQEAAFYNNPRDGWELVIQRFPKVSIDVEESAKCFACERYGASVFHILLVAELGVIEVSQLFGVAGDKPGWGSLDRLQRIHDKKWSDKTTLEQKHSEFLKNVLPLALAIKDSWRHKISHADNKLEWLDTDFSPQLADEIRIATRGMMRRLATDMP
jgi:hypothetical protein